MQIDSPLFYSVKIVSTNPYGSVLESRGQCTADSGVWKWLAILLVTHAIMLIWGNVLTCARRGPPTRNQVRQIDVLTAIVRRPGGTGMDGRFEF